MHHFRQGRFTRQAHKGIPEGAFEEEQGLKGFFGPVSHLIKPQPSTRWESIEGPLRPHMYDLVGLKPQYGHWQKLLFNQQVAMHLYDEPVATSNEFISYRNADADTLFFVHEGEGLLFSEYGLLDYKKGMYLVVPKCLTYALRPKKASRFLVIENKSSHFEEPDRGLVGRHAIYDPEALVKPDLDALHALKLREELQSLKIEVKHRDQKTVFSYRECIYDTLGWKGDLYPFSLDTDHMMPLMSHRAHLPPSAHTTFVARDFVVCTFLPRPLEQDADALKVPFYHQNIDYDEVLFYHDGDFFSRDNLHAGMMSWHPAGFPHGPHPKAVKSVQSKKETSEYAVMVDTRWPLVADESLLSVELNQYWESWKSK